MISRIVCFIIIAFSSIAICKAQNFSGLQNKKLSKVEDLGSSLESLLSRIGGKIEGNIDSVVVISDAEKELRVKIFYTGFVNGFFTVSTMSQSRQQEKAVNVVKFSNPAASSPVEAVLKLTDGVAIGDLPESPYLRIDIAKKDGNPGKVKIFDLRKKWQTTIAPQNVIINVMLQPVGVAASLTNNPVDVMPAKKIVFDPSKNFIKTPYIKTRALRTGGSNFYQPINYTNSDNDISGTWNNTDANTNGLTKLIFSNNKVQIFYKCSPADCDKGNKVLVTINPNSFRTSFTEGNTTTQLNFDIINNTDLQVKQVDVIKLFGLNTTTKTRTYIFKKLPIKFLPAKIYTMDQFTILMPPTTQPVSKVPQGPNKDFPINLWNELAVDNLVDFSRPQEISNINMTVMADKNPNSGIYYITPADFHLRWEPVALPKLPEDGYSFDISYGKQSTDAADADPDAPVRMSAKLTAGISNRERAFVKSLMKTLRPDFVDIRFLPLRENPLTTFQNTLTSQFGVPAEKITVTTSTDLNNDMSIAWRTNADTKEFIQTALTSREGIAASIILKPQDEEIVDQQIPATINIADPRSLGKMSLEPILWRSRNWKNATPYPLQLKYLHVLKKETGGKRPIIYSWSMDNVEVPSQGQVVFNHSKIPTWLDNDPTVIMWLDYSIPECTDCDTKVMSAVTGGVFGNTMQQVKITIAPSVFDTLNASYFMVTVRSLQADPKGTTVKELEAIKIMKDATKDFSAGPLFLAPGNQLDYEYKITVATNDGDFYPSNQWIKATDKELLLGKTKLKEMFKGILPGIN